METNARPLRDGDRGGREDASIFDFPDNGFPTFGSPESADGSGSGSGSGEPRGRGGRADASGAPEASPRLEGLADAIVATVAQPLLILDPRLRVRVANAAFYERFELTPGTSEGRHIGELGDGQWDIPELLELLQRVASREEVVENYQVEHEFPDLGKRIMLINARAMRHTHDVLLLLAIEDATERIRAQREREAYAAELERSNRELQRFAYVASHDLQEPLRTLSSFSQLLERRYAERLDDRAREYIGFMVDAAERMSQLIKDLLKYSRAGTTPLELAPTPLREALDDAVARLRVAVDEAGAEIDVGPLPTVRGDPRLMVQVFQNLISNAIVHHGDEHGDGSPRIRVSAEENAEGWTIRVRDHGPGIPEAYRERIFGIFERLEGGAGGTGIGLAITRRAVERHGGEIWTETPEGGGAAFCFTLPHEPPRADPQPSTASAALAAAPAEEAP